MNKRVSVALATFAFAAPVWMTQPGAALAAGAFGNSDDLGFGPFGNMYSAQPFYDRSFQPYFVPPIYYSPPPINPTIGTRRGASSCASRYRSYRASDNTYQPFTGPRRVCR